MRPPLSLTGSPASKTNDGTLRNATDETRRPIRSCSVAISARSRHRAGRGIEHQARITGKIKSRSMRHRGYGDDAMTAHRAPAFVVHEQHAGVGTGRDRLGQQRAIHVRVAARLEHDRPAEMVEMPLRPCPLVEHGLAFRARQPFDDEAQRLTGGMGVDGPDTVDHCGCGITTDYARSLSADYTDYADLVNLNAFVFSAEKFRVIGVISLMILLASSC